MNLLNELKKGCVVSFFPVDGEFDETLDGFDAEVVMTRTRSTDFVIKFSAVSDLRLWFDSAIVSSIDCKKLGRTVFVKGTCCQLFQALEQLSPVFYEVTDTLRYWAECGLKSVIFRFSMPV